MFIRSASMRKNLCFCRVVMKAGGPLKSLVILGSALDLSSSSTYTSPFSAAVKSLLDAASVLVWVVGQNIKHDKNTL
jgi:hypothetical protein